MISCFTNICLLLLNFQFTILPFSSFSFNGKLNEKDLLISQDSLILGRILKMILVGKRNQMLTRSLLKNMPSK